MSTERIDVTKQRAELLLPYPPSINHYFIESVNMRKGSSYRQLVRAAQAAMGGCSTWNNVRKLLRVTKVPGREGKQYRQAVASRALLLRERGELQRAPLMGKLSCRVLAHARPLKRKRDVDNLLKALLDSLTEAGVYQDDSQIDDLAIAWGWPTRDGEVRVVLQRARPMTEREFLYGSYTITSE